MNPIIFHSLRILLIVTLALTVFLQVFLLPLGISEEAAMYPQLADNAGVYVAIEVLVVACIQVILIAILALLKRAFLNTVFDRRALPWVDAIALVVGLGPAILAFGLWYLGAIDEVANPGTALLFLGTVLGGAILVLLVLVLRGLLRNAIGLTRELAEVI